MSRPSVAIVSLSTLSTGGIETHLLQLFRGLGSEYAFTVFGLLEAPFTELAVPLNPTQWPDILF